MKLIGFRKADFVRKKEENVTGYNVYIATEIDPRRGGGVSVERDYLSDAKLSREGLKLDELLGHDIKVYYNRYGKIDSIVVQD